MSCVVSLWYCSDDFFGDDGPEPLDELFERMAHEWEKLIRLQDPDAIANKYTEDCANVYHKDGETRVVVGREGKILGRLRTPEQFKVNEV